MLPVATIADALKTLNKLSFFNGNIKIIYSKTMLKSPSFRLYLSASATSNT